MLECFLPNFLYRLYDKIQKKSPTSYTWQKMFGIIHGLIIEMVYNITLLHVSSCLHNCFNERMIWNIWVLSIIWLLFILFFFLPYLSINHVIWGCHPFYLIPDIFFRIVLNGGGWGRKVSRLPSSIYGRVKEKNILKLKTFSLFFYFHLQNWQH